MLASCSFALSAVSAAISAIAVPPAVKAGIIILITLVPKKVIVPANITTLSDKKDITGEITVLKAFITVFERLSNVAASLS